MATLHRRRADAHPERDDDKLIPEPLKAMANEILTWDRICTVALISTNHVVRLLTRSAPWQRDNHFITSGYRSQSSSLTGSLKSLLYLHNESSYLSVNIYSHLLGALVLLLIGANLYHELHVRYPSFTKTDLIMFATFLLSAATCFLLSAFCHLISNHSPAGAKVGTSLDYLGIIVFIEGTCVSGFYYGLRLHPTLLYTYWAMILVAGTACTAIAMMPVFHTPPWRATRATTFIGLGLFSILPILHGLYIYGFESLDKMMGLRWSVLQGFFYILGCVIFATRMPERWHPGRFDLLGASHQLFHFCALAASVSQLKALLQAFDYRHGVQPGGA